MFSTLAKSVLCSAYTFRHSFIASQKTLDQCVNFKVLLRCSGHTASDFICPGLIKGIDFIRDNRFNKGLAFTIEERQALGIHGLLAPCYKSQELQLAIATYSIDRYQNNMNKYLYLVELLDLNERLYYKLLDQDIEKYLPIVYTPTVGMACERFGLAYRRPKGLFISIHDKGHILSILNNWPEYDVRAICFTDGERILGLGDLGAYGMGIPIGKLSLYTALAGIKPHQCLPITLDVGTNNEKLITDPLYIGIRQKRVRGEEYFEFVHEFMHACVTRWGSATILQFEDFALQNATPLLEKYKRKLCTFNDDIQGTASVAVAGLLVAQRITKKKISENIILFLGAGSAATGIGHLIVDAMKEEGLSEEDAYGRIFMFDVEGLLTNSRSKGVPQHAVKFGKDVEAETNFENLVAKLKPNCLIGCSTVGGAFSPTILNTMAKNNERPIIFALSNPTKKAECTAQDAYDNTEGRCIFASGSPFPPVQYGGKTYITGQGNNSYIFPGVALGVIVSRSTLIPDIMFLQAAKSLAKYVSEDDLSKGLIYPPLADLKKVSLTLAVDIFELAYKLDLATKFPKPKKVKEYIMSQLYNLDYPSVLPHTYKYPPEPDVEVKSVQEVYGKGPVPGPFKGKPNPKV